MASASINKRNAPLGSSDPEGLFDIDVRGFLGIGLLEMKRWLPDVLSVLARKKDKANQWNTTGLPKITKGLPKGYQFHHKAMRVSKKSYAMRVWARRYRASINGTLQDKKAG